MRDGNLDKGLDGRGPRRSGSASPTRAGALSLALIMAAGCAVDDDAESADLPLLGEEPAASACPDERYLGLPGHRVKAPNSPEVFMVDPEGDRRLIPDPGTYLRLFRDWGGIITINDMHCIRRGKDVSPRDFLAQSDSGPEVFFVEFLYQSGDFLVYWPRWIPSVSVFDRYHFRWQSVALTSGSWLAAWRDEPNWN